MLQKHRKIFFFFFVTTKFGKNYFMLCMHYTQLDFSREVTAIIDHLYDCV